MADLTDMLDQARSLHTSVMVDAVTIDRATTAFDRETGVDVETWETVWAGPARYPRADATARAVSTGQTITPAGPVVIVPWDVVGVRPDDRVTCTSSVSPGMVGRILWVTDTSPRTFQSAVHLTCREVR